MQFNLAKAIIDGQITITAVNSKDIVNKAIKIFGLSPLSADVLGRTLTVVALMSASLKNKKDCLTVTIDGGGVAGKITACGDSNCNIKGFVENPVVENIFNDFGKLDTAKAVGNDGKITVIKDIGLNQPYVGTSKLTSGQIADDFAHYFALSEQSPCALTVGLTFKNSKCFSSGGVLIQALPNCSKQLLDKVETTVYAMDEMSWQFEDSTARQVVERFFGKYENFSITHEGFAKYKCNCSQRRIEKLIKSLGKIEADSIIEDVGKIEVHCHFCNKTYTFDKLDVDEIFCVKNTATDTSPKNKDK